MKRRLSTVLAIGLGLAATPAAANGATAYVNDGGTAVAGCTTPANPCGTLTNGLGVAGPGGTVIVDIGTGLSEQVTLTGGQDVLAQDFDGIPEGAHAFLDGGAGTAVTVAGAGASIDGFDIRGDVGGVQVNAANFTISDSVFQETAPEAVDVRSGPAGGGLVIDNGIFIDNPTPADSTRAIVLGADASVDAAIDNFYRAVDVVAPATVRLSLGVTGVREGPGSSRGIGLLAEAQGVTVHVDGANFYDPAPGATTAIDLMQPDSAPVSATLNRVRATAHQIGLRVDDTAGPVTLESSLLAANSRYGLYMTGSAAGRGNVTATNITALDNGTRDIRNEGALLTLDSSITGNGVDASGGGSCAISFSRGPALSGNCSSFQTTANPGVTPIDPFGDYDYSLAPGSAMLDMGNPAPPPPGAIDFQADPRGLDATPSCGGGDVARRDIGADEFVPPAPNCTPPPAADTVAPETTIDRGPKKKVRSKSKRAKARFAFGSTEAGSRFECSLDGAPFTPCQSGVVLTVIAKRRFKRHEFRVVAIDAVGNRDQTPAEFGWKVRRKPKRR